MGRLYRKDEELVGVHTTITKQERDERDKNGWEWNELIRLGMRAMKDNPQLIDRISVLESEIKRLKRVIVQDQWNTKNFKQRVNEMLIEMKKEVANAIPKHKG